MKKTVIGILAHVDAGKTTLSESILYLSGQIRKQGRVDHQDAFLDYDPQERNRGITIFSKQAMFAWKDVQFTMIDTPGHVDFSTEMERTLQVLDYAIMIINGIDGVQNHTKTIWDLLKYYEIPTLIFINKMDMPQTDSQKLIEDIQTQLDERCFDLSYLNETTYENLALINEDILNEYLSTESIDLSHLSSYLNQRQFFPCFFGSALKMEGVDTFLDTLVTLIDEKTYPQEFGAKVFKISRDEQGQRLTHMKITGGVLKVKENISQEEKVDQIRQYNGLKYEMRDQVMAGEICAVKGLKNIQAGDSLGIEKQSKAPVLSSYIHYHLHLPDDCDRHQMIQNLNQLSEEDPSLNIQTNSQGDIIVQLMGEIQTEVLQKIIQQRFHVDVTFDQGEIIYKETIKHVVEGVGHYEPLRHYAEVHLLLEPGERGSGLQFASACPEDVLERHWQRLVLTHLQEKEHIGVLTGSPITDIKITLLTGRAHIKHTEGGDFRQATYRAVRNGLKKAQSVLLEPYYHFQLTLPHTYLSRALYDMETMNARFSITDASNDLSIIEGDAPVRKMQNYQNDVIHYTKGEGKLFCSLKGYEECIDQSEIIEQMNYDSESDLNNPTGSVFCSHGAGFNVKWDEVEQYMHLPAYQPQSTASYSTSSYHSHLSEDEELEQIFTRTYGKVERRLSDNYQYKKEKQPSSKVVVRSLPECLLVDGYNVIHAWEELSDIAKDNLDAARTRLIDILGNYQGYKQCTLIIVFDAYKVKGNIGTTEHIHNVHVVYTKEAQTADMYIERATHELSKNYNVVVATSDALEQIIVIGRGARRMSSRELKLEVEAVTKTQKEEFERKQEKSHNLLLEDISKYNEK